MLADGVASRASDIHVEPIEGGVAVRYRIDGVLRQVMKVPRNAGLPLISRIKIMSGLDIADRLRPQDGRARVSIGGEPIDLRVSTLPASLGEKVVIRILSQRATVLDLDALGMHEDEQQALHRLLNHKEGIVLVTGPTGSGKTTTLYSAIRLIQNPGVNIVTVEDPVEYRLGQNIVQVQVHDKAGLTFASALRSILRQDPDVVLIGEIRDQETAQIALQASLTGHLVLSTLHTNDAPNAVTRLVDMGMEPYKIASALRGVVAQRLMRRLCTVCRVPSDEPAPERVARYLPAGTRLYKAVGCPECAMTGYRGRFSVVEVLSMNAQLERDIGQGATADSDRRRTPAPTGWARSGRAGCGTCWPASPPWTSCSGSPMSPPRPRRHALRARRPRLPVRLAPPPPAPVRCATLGGAAGGARRRVRPAGGGGRRPGGTARPPRGAPGPPSCWWRTRSSCAGS